MTKVCDMLSRDEHGDVLSCERPATKTIVEKETGEKFDRCEECAAELVQETEEFDYVDPAVAVTVISDRGIESGVVQGNTVSVLAKASEDALDLRRRVVESLVKLRKLTGLSTEELFEGAREDLDEYDFRESESPESE